MRRIAVFLTGVVAVSSAMAADDAPARHAVTVIGQPLVMRVNKDEFRIAFGIDGKQCMPAGCSGLIHYRVHWKAAEGIARSELRSVSYRVSPSAGRTIAVDRQYLDTAEGAHTTDVTGVSVDHITCTAESI